MAGSCAFPEVVRGALRRRWITVLGVIAFFGLTVLLLGNLSTGFFPAQDNSQTQVTITTQPGSTIEQTDAAALAAGRILAGYEHVTGVFQATGSASSGAGPGGGNTTQLQLTLAGDDSALLEQAASALEAQVRTLQGIGNVTSSAAMQSPEIVIRSDLARAASLGITSQGISDAIRVATSGGYDAAMSKLNLPERQVPIRVMLAESNRQTLGQIAAIPVAGKGGNVSLGTIADISLGAAPSQIDRLDRKRNVTLTVALNGRNLSDVQAEAEQLPAYRDLPNGVLFVAQGDLKRPSELFSSFASAMAIGVFCIYAVLELLFGGFLQPVTILMALPLALGGALLPLVVSGTSFSMPAVIGLLLLMGIVTKNSILLVEYAIMARRGGSRRFDALVDACHKRARPIVMTTIAMAGGMAPAALSLVDREPSFRQPMAVVVIGGLITSTFLSLLVIPVVFTFIDDLGRLPRGKWRQPV